MSDVPSSSVSQKSASHSLDYDLPDEVSASTSGQLKALADPTRVSILDLVLERSATVTELAAALDRPKSSVAYHVDKLVSAGLLQIVHTRKVRAIEERFYGRTGRTIKIGGGDGQKKVAGENFLTIAEREVLTDRDILATLRHARISERDAEEFFARVAELAEDFTRLQRSGDTVFGFVAGVYATNQPRLGDSPAEKEKSK